MFNLYNKGVIEPILVNNGTRWLENIHSQARATCASVHKYIILSCYKYSANFFRA